jgi:hypothetical protein
MVLYNNCWALMTLTQTKYEIDWTPLIIAVKNRHEFVVQLLLERQDFDSNLLELQLRFQ